MTISSFFSDHVNAPLNYYRAIMRYKNKMAKSLRSDIHVPTLIIWATGDKALVTKQAETIGSFVKHNCDIVYLEGGSHWIQQERPQEVNQCIRDYLAKDVSHYIPSKL